MADEVDTRLPSPTEPFDMAGCSELPFPLTEYEDKTLKDILRIAGSDQQMIKRAYDAIICMWARKIVALNGGPPHILGITPADSSGIDDIVVDVMGQNFDIASKVYFKGFLYTPTSYVPGVFQHLFITINIADIKRVGGLYPIYVINPTGLYSNSLNFQVNEHTPRIDTLSPVNAPPNSQVVLTVTGDYFDDLAHVYFNGYIINNAADIISRSRTQLVVKFLMPPLSPWHPTVFVASGVNQVISFIRIFQYA